MARTPPDFDGEDRRSPERWKVKKEISLVDIITIVSAILSIVFAYTTLDKRTTALEQAAIIQAATDKRQDEDGIRTQGRIDEQLRELNRKIDRLIERGAR